MSTPEYKAWMKNPTPENMSAIVDAMAPLVNSEIQRYNGPKPLLKTKAKSLTVSAIKSYDPKSGAQLPSWVVTQLQPLSRYGQKLRPIHASEAVIRQAAELNRLETELSDELDHNPTEEELADKSGISVAKIRRIKSSVPAVLPASAFDTADENETSNLPAVTVPNRMGTAEDAVYESLGARDKAIFDLKTGRGGQTLTNEQIAKRLGVTPALISQRSKYVADQINGLYTRKIL